MNKTASFLVGAAMLAATAVLPLAAFAQSSQAMMPTLYDAAGNPVNTTVSKVPAGYYFLQTGGQHQIYYYGNGTYYDASTGTYGGSTSNPNGTAGAGLGYVPSTGTVVAAAPGVPNTGAGGDAPLNWALLAVSGAVVLAGAAFMTYSLTGKNTA